jgi:ABC-type nickel/cobalt efflux system permease component RcnA
MEITEVRTWVMFYLLSFVVLLVAIFITTRNDSRLWISLMLVIIVVGINFYMLFSELKRYQARKAFMHRMSKFDDTGADADSSGHRW